MKRVVTSSIFALAFLALSVFFPLIGRAAPPNDNFADSISIIGTNVTLQGTNVSATLEPGEPPSNPTNSSGGTVWYSWTAPFTGEVQITGSSCCLTPSMAVYTGTSVSNLSFVIRGQNTFSFLAASNTTYDLQVDSENGLTGVFTLTLNATLSLRPLNDKFTNSIALTGTNVTVQSVNTSATIESGENTGGGGALLESSVWYSWTAPADGVAHLSVASLNSDQNFIPGVQGFTGNTIASLVSPPVTQAGDIPVTNGEIIQIQVSSIWYTTSEFGGDTGPFSLNIALDTAQPASTNDYFADRLEITTPAYHFAGSLYGATDEPGEPLPASGATQTLWWDFTPPGSGTLTVTLSGLEYPAYATLYDGTNLASLIPQSGLPGSILIYQILTNHEYSLQVASVPAVVGDFSLDTLFAPQAYDNFETPQPLVGTNIVTTSDNTLATLEPGEPEWNTNNAGHTLWYSWAAPFTGRVNITSGSCCVTRSFAVYTGDSLASLTLVTAAVDSLSFMAVSNTVYKIQFDSNPLGRVGSFNFTLNASPFLPAANDNFTNAIVLAGNQASGSGPVSFATTEPGEPAHLNGTPCKSLWWTWQAPVNATVATVRNSGSLATNVVYAVYIGSSVDTLTLVAKGSNAVSFAASGGNVFQIAAVVDQYTIGDVSFNVSLNPSSASIPVPGNLLCQGSFENTGLNLTCWQKSGALSGFVNDPGGADGTTWPWLNTPGVWISQTFATTPGCNYQVTFALKNAGSAIQASWNSTVLGTATIPSSATYWIWTNYVVTATSNTSTLMLQNVLGGPALDAVSVIWLNQPPTIITPPASASTLVGGDVNFLVGATGGPPMSYQWFFNNSPLPGETAKNLELDEVLTNQAGLYYVIVTNAYGSATSAPVTLVVQPTNHLVMDLQPSSDTVAPGGYYDLSTAVSGPGPITYQWYLNNSPLAGATNQELIFNPFQATNVGTYEVLAQNGQESVLSLPATLTADTNDTGGAKVLLANDFFVRTTETYAPVYDVDGVTMLSSSVSDYVAQLYAGPVLALLRPAGNLSTFNSNYDAGLINQQMVTLPTVPPGSNAFVQIRVWDRKNGLSYEEARALGGKFGRSAVLQVTTSGPLQPPPNLIGLTSFSLQAGLPQFSAGIIQHAGTSNGVPVWSLIGNAGYEYVIMRSADNLSWQPMSVITNVTGTVTFVDPAPSTNSACVFYRARILD